MIFYNNILFFLVLFTCLCFYGKTFTIKDYEIYDLEFNSEDFANEASKWNVSGTNLFGKTYTDCNGKFLLGGYEVTWVSSISFKRTYEGLPTHKTVFLNIELWLLGSWDVFDSINIRVSTGNSLISSRILYPIIPPVTLPRMVCGDANLNNAMPVTLLFQLPHTSSNISLEFGCQSQYIPGQTLGYCGIRNLRMLLSSSVVSEGLSTLVQSGANGIFPYNAATCPSGKFRNSGSGLCDNCNSNCENCLDSTTCLSCKKHLLYDGSNCLSCHSNCLSCYGPLDTQCVSCNPGKYLYYDNTCRSLCQAPFRQVMRNNILYCEFPCKGNAYLYPDGSCQPSCPSPLVSKDYESYKTCESPCSNSGHFYYLIENSCQAGCSDPYLPIQTKFYNSCYLPLQLKAVDYIRAATGGIASICLLIQSMILVADPTALLVGTFSNMNHYIKYLNISYSEDVADTLELEFSGSIAIDFWFSRSDMTEQEFEENTAPYVFKKQRLHPRFIDNYGPAVIVLLIVAVICIILKLIEWLSKRNKKAYLPLSVLSKSMVISRNLLYTLFYIAYPNIILLSVVDFRSSRSRSDLDGISACISALLLLMGVKVSYSLFRLMKQEDKLIEEDIIITIHDLENFYETHEMQQVLLRGFQESPLLTHLFPLISVGRATLCALIITIFLDNPLVQTILLSIISFLMIIYLICQQPLKDKTPTRFQYIYESILLCINVGALTMAALEKKGNLSFEASDGLGKFIISFKLLFNFAVLINIGIRGYETFKNRKNLKKIPQTVKVGAADNTSGLTITKENEVNRNISMNASLFESSAVPRNLRNAQEFKPVIRDENMSNMFIPLEKTGGEDVPSFDVSRISFANKDDSMSESLKGKDKNSLFTSLGRNQSRLRKKGSKESKESAGSGGSSGGESSKSSVKGEDDGLHTEFSIIGGLSHLDDFNNDGLSDSQKSVALRRAESHHQKNVRPIKIGQHQAVQKLSLFGARPNSSPSHKANRTRKSTILEEVSAERMGNAK